ncbi:MAG: hypothetical protein WA885_12065 [Phormidesmis sp.]
MIVRAWVKLVGTGVAIAMMIAGIAAAWIWKTLGLSGALYEVLLGIAASADLLG